MERMDHANTTGETADVNADVDPDDEHADLSDDDVDAGTDRDTDDEDAGLAEGDEEYEYEDEDDSLLLGEDETAPNLVPEEHPKRVLAGRIEIFEKIGEGGMGAVWRGLHLKLQRVVAVKILDETLQLRPDGRERFIREARALALLTHRNVVAVHDCDELPDGRLYLCMELLEGDTLRDIIKRGERLDPLEVIDVGMQICDAVQAAHDCGILHRDLTPSNIIRLRDADKTIKVIDWGLCKYLDLFYVRSTQKYTAPPGARMVTPLGCRFGTPEYMAPEMIVRDKPGAPSFCTDVYALAVVLYELLTGRHPFAPGQRKVPRPIREVLPAFDYHDLEAVLRAALRYLPEERTPTMSALHEGLDLARECLLAQRGESAPASAEIQTPTPDVVQLADQRFEASRVVDRQAYVVAVNPGPSSESPATALPSTEPRAADTNPAASGRSPEQARVVPFRRRGGSMPALLAALFGVGVGVAGTLVAQRVGDPPTVSDPRDLPTRLRLAQARAEAAEAHAGRCETDAASRAAEPREPLPDQSAPVQPPSLPAPEKPASRVLAAVSRGGGSHRAEVLRPRPTSTTFSAAMARLQSKIRSCARTGGMPEGAITVQVRRQGDAIDTVKVLKFTKDHPSVACIDEVIRKAGIPPGDRPVENFTFPK